MHTEVENFYVSFSDLMSLLLIFFVYLFSMSTIDPVKYQQVTDSLKGEFSTQQPPPSMAERVERRDADAILLAQLTQAIKSQQLEQDAKITVDEGKVKVVLSSPVLFRSGDANLSLPGQGILKGFANIIAETRNPVVVDGHTDDRPIRNASFQSNWELSFYRAYSVMTYLMGVSNLSPQRLSGTGYGEYRPLLPNTSETNRAKNRRIEIALLKTYPKSNTTPSTGSQ